MNRRCLSFAGLLFALFPGACREAPPPAPSVASSEVRSPVLASSASPAPSASAPPVASASVPVAASAAPALPPPAPARLDWVDVVAVARPKTEGAGPGTPPDPCARGRNTPECEVAGLADPPDPRAARRAGLQFETHAGLVPKPALDAASAAVAAQAIKRIETQAFLCAFTYAADSMRVAVDLTTAGGSDGVHARITGSEAAPEFARCMLPCLENGSHFAPDGAPRHLRFDLALRAVWH